MNWHTKFKRTIKYFLASIFFLILLGFVSSINSQYPLFWGFFAHKQINRLAVFTLPPEMMGFYKKNIELITENAVNPDKRRYSLKGEAARHFIDLESYGDSAAYKLPRFWKDALAKYGEDSLQKHGIVPWHIQLMKFQLTEAFKQKNTKKILQLSADLGHYIADANVPLHTTKNYDGQLSKQEGIHAFWESRLPELFSEKYDFFVGQAEYLKSPQKTIWQAIAHAHACLDSVLRFENELTLKIGENKKYTFEEKNGLMVKTYSPEFSRLYHEMLRSQVERQMRTSIKMIGDFWLTCWVDAGQPDLSQFAHYQDVIKDKEDDLQKVEATFKVRKEGD